jgi:hypothetical protein
LDPPTSGTSDAARCSSLYPATLPFDIGESIEVAVAAPTGVGAGPAPRSVDTIAAECVAGHGQRCSTATFISMQAALCIAQAEAMIAPGYSALRAGLIFSELATVEWTVEVYYPRADDPYCFGLRLIRIDAVTGVVRSSTSLTGCA